ncbi:hypothetical protein ACW7BJ_30615 [Azospirillum argentinense]
MNPSDLESVAYTAEAKLYAQRVIDWTPEELDKNVQRLTTWYVEERIMKGSTLGPFTETAAISWLRLLKISKALLFDHRHDRRWPTEALSRQAWRWPDDEVTLIR